MTHHPLALDITRNALFLDFDGTLVGFADDPGAVAIDPAALHRLSVLKDALDGALAIVSGRRIADLDRFLAPYRFAAAGVHGLERRPDPERGVEVLAGPETLETVRQALGESLIAHPALHLEDKGTALVLHYRAHPELEAAARSAMEAAVGGRDDLTLMHGNMIFEVHPAGMDKGMAVRGLMEHAPFAGRIPVYVGDDTTDEFAFQALGALSGFGIKVGQGTTAARHRLADIDAVHAWLGVAGR